MTTGNEEQKPIDLRVAAGSSSVNVAAACVRYIAEGHDVEMTALGAGAVNQMVKACAHAQSMGAAEGRYLSFTFASERRTIGNEEKNVMRTIVHHTRRP